MLDADVDERFNAGVEEIARQITAVAAERKTLPGAVVQEVLDLLAVFRRMRGNTVGHHMAFAAACALKGQSATLMLTLPPGAKDLGIVSISTDVAGLLTQLLK